MGKTAVGPACLLGWVIWTLCAITDVSSLSEEGSKSSNERVGDARIVGGEIVESPDNFPFFAIVLRWGLSHCGGLLIHPEFILTSAHCNEGGLTAVIPGYYNPPHPPNQRLIRQIFQHPSYNDALQTFDFLLLQLDEPVTDVQMVSWDRGTSGQLMEDESVTVIGIGSATLTGDHSEILREVTVPIVSFEECNLLYGGRITEEAQICAGFPGKDACQGDSGGPLLKFDNAKGEYIAVGISTWGWYCGIYPGVYARLQVASDWIDQILCDHTSDSSLRPSTCVGPPPLDPLEGKIPVWIEIMFDAFPHDLSFSITRTSDGLVELEYPDFPFLSLGLSPFANISDRVFLDPEEQYELELNDFVGDGFEQGSFRVYTTTTNGEETTLAEDRGVMGATRIVPFETPSVTGPTCADIMVEFCSWLSGSPLLQSSLCPTSSYVASNCPETCSTCYPGAENEI